MGKDPSEIRAEIEQTRERVGDEVDALSYKTDVGARVGDYVDDKKEVAARVVCEPFRNEPGLLQGLGFGVAGSSGSKFGTSAIPKSIRK